MPEALTESFCERCGTRYEFAAPTKLNTIRKTRGLISGLKNYIMSQDALGDAVGDAIKSEEEDLASQQLEAFHESFNFCIDCRQYTCTNCWNDDSGRCRTCVPIAGTDDLLERFEATFHAQHPELAAAAEADLAQAEVDRHLGMEAWPTEDLASRAGNGHGPVEWPAGEATVAEAEVEPEPEPEPVVAEVEPEPEPEPVVAEVEPEPEPEPVVAEVEPEPEPEPVVAEVEVEPEPLVPAAAELQIEEAYPPLRLVAWEEDAPFALEPEPVVAEVEVEPEPEPVVAEVEVEPEPEPVVAEVEVEPEPEPLAPQPIRPISETIVRVPRPAAPPPVEQPERVAAQAEDPSVAARRAQLDILGLGDQGEGPVGPDRSKVLPYRSSGASVHAGEAAARAAAGLPMAGSFWEASAREVAGAMSHVGVQSCGNCGLSLSASARFCRRCGTRQARSA
jgi:ribosomal protein L40E